MRRLRSVALVTLALAPTVSPSFVAAIDLSPPAVGEGLAASFDLKQQLEKGLKARRPSDFAFISCVVTKVELGLLPRKLVDQTLSYARNRSREYPFLYFEFALRKQAQKLGVSL